ncbi:TolC family protein [Massilia sp. TS11]|uniref:TolC family protein n=1 Tax=Massilia sp. TS11 TaxID=2908003 RepID=UPI001EDB5BD9|nr:TolC family protein [Massilia sp. TS11]MCG2584194.1 TolC family protein [Massilia sp. TS11]
MKLLPFALAAALLTGCASFSEDGGRTRIDQLRAERGLPQAAAADQVEPLLAKPLGPDAAVRIALARHPRLGAAYAELGMAEAELVQAGRLPNPGFSFKRTSSHGDVDIERTLMLPLYALFTMGPERAMQQQRFSQAQLRTAQEALAVANEARRAFYGAVAAQQMLAYAEQVKDAADASHDLAQRMAKAGNWSAFQQARQQAFFADAVAALAKARQQAVSERERLTRALGLDAPRFTLPERLPDLPAAARSVQDAEATALRTRLDILSAENEVAAVAASHRLIQTQRFVNVLEAGPVRASGGNGVEIGLEIPLFDFGDARAARARADYERAVLQARAAALTARSEVRAAHASYTASYDIARHYRDEIVPLKKRIADEQLLRYNGMLTSVFELLADAREQIQAVSAAIEAQRDFWLADAALDQALVAGSPSKD